MKSTQIISGLAIFVFLSLIGCKKETAPLEPLSALSANLIKNSSFEENGDPSLSHWYIRESDSISFANDTPPGGGNWSICLPAVWYGPLPVSPAYFVPLTPGKHILELSFYGKFYIINGVAMFILKTDQTRDVSAIQIVTDTVWTKYTLTDTVFIQEGDSLSIVLSGGGTENVGGFTCFDLVELFEHRDN